jgi:hypothetical protein
VVGILDNLFKTSLFEDPFDFLKTEVVGPGLVLSHIEVLPKPLLLLLSKPELCLIIKAIVTEVYDASDLHLVVDLT